jgi:hypothetical protein
MEPLCRGTDNCRFYDVSGFNPMDFVCQYRAPAPCKDGYTYFNPAGTTVKEEYGMSSCIKVFPADTYARALDTCGTPKDGSGKVVSWLPDSLFVNYLHLVTLQSLDATPTGMAALIKRLASKAGINYAAPSVGFWTGAMVFVTNGQLAPQWVDTRPFVSANTPVTPVVATVTSNT